MNSPVPQADTHPNPVVRHDGWTGDKMARFCEVLAETAVVAEACEMVNMGISGAYALRRRNPVFAAGWDAALTIARERLADTLLARSMEGNVEYLYRNGEVVGERQFLDNKLGLAILRRLDRIAETGASVSSRGERAPTPVRDGRSAHAPTCHPRPLDWDLALTALRTGDEEAIASSLAIFDPRLASPESGEVEEVEDPRNSLNQEDEDDCLDLSDRFWTQDEMGETVWMTDFPPPPGFTGFENRAYDEGQELKAYERECTPEEVATLQAGEARDRALLRAEDEELRDAWFSYLRSELPGAGDTPGAQEHAGA